MISSRLDRVGDRASLRLRARATLLLRLASIRRRMSRSIDSQLEAA
jgi:hypothetical protein